MQNCQAQKKHPEGCFLFAGNPRLALHVLWQVRLDSSQHGLEALDVARNDMALVEEVVAW